MKKIILILLSFLLADHMLLSQDAERQILFEQLQKTSSDEERFNIIRDIGYSYEFTDSSTAMNYYRQNLGIALKRNDCNLLSKTYTDFGNVCKNGGRYAEAKKHHLKSLAYGVQCNNSRQQAVAYANLGNLFMLTNENDSSIYYHIKSGKMFEEARDTLRSIQVYSNIAAEYYTLHQYQNSIDIGNKCIPMCISAGDMDNLAANYITLASGYRWLGQQQKADEYANKAKQIAPLANDYYIKANIYQNIASYYNDMGVPIKGLAYADTCVALSRELEMPNVITACLLVKGTMLTKLEKFEEADPYITEALKYAEAEGEWFGLRELYLAKSKIEFSRNNFKQAYEYLDAHLVYKDSLFNKEVADKTNELNAHYQSVKREQEIERLEKANEVATIKANLQMRITILIVVLGFLVILASVLFYFNFKRKSKINEQKNSLQQQRIRELENETQIVAMDAIIKGEEQERSRVAKDLHDGLGSLLSGVKLSLSSMKGNVIISEEHANLFNSSLRQLDNAINEMRRVAHNMMPESLVKFGLIQAIQNMCESLNESGAIKIHLEQYHFTQRLHHDQEITVYRMVQEMVNNALKHANAKNIIIQMSQNEGRMQLVVEDDGIGFDSANTKQHEGTGFTNLRHRLNYLKGTMDIKSDIGKGTSILMEFPII